MVVLPAVAFSALMGAGLGSTIFIKLNSTANYTLGKFLGHEYGKDLNNRVFVYIPSQWSILKNFLIHSISSLLSYKIASITASKLLSTEPLLNRVFVITTVAFPLLMNGIVKIVEYDSGSSSRRGVYLSGVECQNDRIDPAQIERIQWGVEVYDRESLFSLLGLPTFLPGELTEANEF
jgi:hypothetical protein